MDSYLSCSRHRKRLIVRRVLVCTFTFTIFCLLFFPSTVVSLKTHSPTFRPNSRAHDYLDLQHDVRIRLRTHLQSFRQWADRLPYGKSLSRPQAVLYPESSVTAPEDGDLKTGIEKLTEIMGGESRTDHLLSPFTLDFQAHVRDLGSRARVFKEALNAWEDLHFVPSSGRLLQASEIFQSLRASSLPRPFVQNAINSYDHFRLFVNQLSARLFHWTMPYYGDHMSLHASFHRGGRGIVYTAGDRQLPYVETSIKSIRRLGCDLPIEILYLGDDDMAPQTRSRLESLSGVVTRDLSVMIDDDGWELKGWAGKPFAILMSSFREALFIDADALFFSDPARLFDHDGYRETGALFFKDRNLLSAKNMAWVKGIFAGPTSKQVEMNRMWQSTSEHMQDSGVMLIDKWRHFVPLLLATRLNGPDRHADGLSRLQGMYDLVYGDKETFWMSWELAGDADYAFHNGVTASMGTPLAPEVAASVREIRDEEDEEADSVEEDPSLRDGSRQMVCSAQLLHLDERGRPLWFNGWIGKDKYTTKTRKAISFAGFIPELPDTQMRPASPMEDPWVVQDNNIMCLKGEGFAVFTADETSTLAMLIATANEFE